MHLRLACYTQVQACGVRLVVFVLREFGRFFVFSMTEADKKNAATWESVESRSSPNELVASPAVGRAYRLHGPHRLRQAHPYTEVVVIFARPVEPREFTKWSHLMKYQTYWEYQDRSFMAKCLSVIDLSKILQKRWPLGSETVTKLLVRQSLRQIANDPSCRSRGSRISGYINVTFCLPTVTALVRIPSRNPKE